MAYDKTIYAANANTVITVFYVKEQIMVHTATTILTESLYAIATRSRPFFKTLDTSVMLANIRWFMFLYD